MADEVTIPTVDEAMLDLVEWVEGRRSWTNTIYDVTEDRGFAVALVAVADAAEVVKRAALVVALSARSR